MDEMVGHGHHGHAGGHGSVDFDERAATWDDDPTKVERARVVADAILAAVPADASTRLLELGAGTGLLTQALAASVGPVTLADTSAGMRDVMRQKVDEGALPAGTRIWDVDLSATTVPGESFDLVVTLLALHHVHDVDAALANVAALLVSGGRLCVADLEHEDGSFHGPGFEGHAGFEPDALAARLRNAGFDEVDVAPCHYVVRDGRTYPLFLAVAVRR